MSEHSKSNNIALIIVLVIVLIGAAGGAWYFLKYKPELEAKEKARLEQIAQQKEKEKKQKQAAENKAKYDNLIEQADSAFEQQQWQKAYGLYSEASSVLPNQDYCQNRLDLVRKKLDEQAAIQKRIEAGILEMIDSKTGRFYVIVSSSVDIDLATDYALELMRQGYNARIIKDAGVKKLFNRVTVADYSTVEVAERESENYRALSEKVWVLKY